MKRTCSSRWPILGGLLVHQLIWVSTLGIVRNWDLFGFTWMPLAYLGYRALEVIEPPPSTALATFALALLGGFSWVLSFA